MLHYLKQLLIAVDQLFNAVLGGAPDETISAAQWRLKRKWAVAIIDWVFGWFGEKDHCEASYYHELLMKDLPEEYRIGREQ